MALAHAPVTPALATQLTKLAVALGVLGAALLGQYAVAHPDFLHLDVGLTGATVAAVSGALLLCVFILRRADVALALLVAIVYLNLSHVLVRQGFPSLLQFVAVPVFIAAVLHRDPREWAQLASRPLTWLLVGYTLVLLGSTTYAQAPELADARVADTVKALLIYLAVVLLVSSARRAFLAAWTVLTAGSLLAVLGILRVAGIRIAGVSDALARFELAHIYGTLFEPRITGPLGDANFFAQILLVLVPIGLFLAWGARHRWQRMLAYAAVVVVIAATVLTYSRGGALALGVVLALSLLAHGISWRRLAVGGVALASLWTFALPTDFTARLRTVRELLPGEENITGRRDSSFEERLLLTGTAWEMFAANPTLGVGAGNYTERFNEYAERMGSTAKDYHDPNAARYPHNLFLEVGAETGVPGFVLFAGALVAAFAALRRVRRTIPAPGEDDLRGLGRAFQIALAGYLVSSLFLHGDYQRYLWLLLGMVGAMDTLVMPRRTQRVRVRRASRPEVFEPAAPAPTVDRVSAAPKAVRPPIAVLLSRFPSVTETFVLREVIEMERQGQPVVLMPLLRESPPIVHQEARPWMERAVYTPFLSLPILAANVRAFARHPGRYVSVVARVIAGTLRSPRIALGTIGIIPKSVYLAERVRAEGIRHVHAHFASHPTTAALIISTLSGSSFSFTIHAHDLFSARYRPLLPLKLRHAAFVRVISQYNLGYLRQLYPEVPLEHVHVVHVGIDPDLYASDNVGAPRPSRLHDATTASLAPVRVVSVAALRDYKGLPVLLEACARLQRQGIAVECDVVGEGPMRGYLERMLVDLDLDRCVRLVGAKPQHEVRRLLAERPIFVLSSVVLRDGWMEGIPVALMEAMASGCPVVTSRISGIPELVESGVSGMLVEPGDVKALAESIRTLAAEPDLVQRLGAGGREKVNEKFRLDRTVAELLSLIDAHNDAPTHPLAEAIAGPLRASEGAPALGVRRVHDGADATVVELIVPAAHGPASELVGKQHKERPGASGPAAERAHNEWAVLNVFREGWVQEPDEDTTLPPFGVPRAVWAALDQGVLAMEACPGHNLGALLRSTRATRDGTQWAATLSALRQAGTWLRRFQRHRSAAYEPEAGLAAWDEAAEGDLAQCSGMVSSHLLRAVRSRLTAHSITVAAQLKQGVLCHGDFGPGNVFVSDERVEAIDFEGIRAGLPYEDVAYFVVQLELFLAWPWLRTRRHEAVGAFLEGYLGGETMDQAAYRMARLSKLLQILARHRATGRRGPAALRRRGLLVRLLEDAV